jgi:hypothetical protein
MDAQRAEKEGTDADEEGEETPPSFDEALSLCPVEHHDAADGHGVCVCVSVLVRRKMLFCMRDKHNKRRRRWRRWGG